MASKKKKQQEEFELGFNQGANVPGATGQDGEGDDE